MPPLKRISTLPRYFSKAGSVFANFVESDAGVGFKCFDYDAKIWKLPKIVRRDAGDLSRLEEMIQQDYPNMLEI